MYLNVKMVNMLASGKEILIKRLICNEILIFFEFKLTVAKNQLLLYVLSIQLGQTLINQMHQPATFITNLCNDNVIRHPSYIVFNHC